MVSAVSGSVDANTQKRRPTSSRLAASACQRPPPPGRRSSQRGATIRCIERARAIQARQAETLRGWLEEPAALARSPHLRGGLSPAALRRVEVYVEAGLDRRLPRAFVEARRIARARHLIGETAQPLAAIALDTGFSTQSRLTTAFKRVTGFTPAAYRRSGAR